MKIVTMSDNPLLPTGQARVHREIATALHNAGHQVTAIGWHRDPPRTYNVPFKIISCDNVKFGQDVFDEIMLNEQPELLITIGDPWQVSYIPRMRMRQTCVWCQYLAVDGERLDGGLPNFWIPVLENADKVIAYTEYGKIAIERTLPSLLGKVDIIYHGVDHKVFIPYSAEQRKKVRQQHGIDDKFIFLVVARNQPRKNISHILLAWKRFIANGNYKNCRLWLHMNFKDTQGIDMAGLIDNYRLNDSDSILYFQQIAEQSSGIDLLPESKLVDLYNFSDRLVNASSEGYGLPIIEAMSCKLPCILLNHSAPAELGANGRALFVDVAYDALGRYFTERPFPDIDDMIRMFKKAYNMKDEQRQIMKDKAYEFAMKHTWEIERQNWVKTIDKISNPLSTPITLEEIS